MWATSAVALLSQPSCNIINPEEPVPTYIRVDSFAFNQGTAVPGTASHKVTSVLANFDGKSLGIFVLPAVIPVIAEKPGQLILLPGIDYNALRGQQKYYPFFEGYTQTLNPSPGNTVAVPATTTYFSGTRTAFQEDFEGGVGFNKLSGDTGLIRSNLPGTVYEGGYSGAIYLGNGNTTAQVASQTPLNLTVGREAFIELNYKNTMPIQIGLLGVDAVTGALGYGYIIALKPRTDWNKVYIDLSAVVGLYQGGSYSVIIRADLGDNQTSGEAFVDNFRVVTYN